MIETEADLAYFEEYGAPDGLDEVILHDQSCLHEPIRYVRRDKAPADTSDGYHTFAELYEHRTGLLVALCNFVASLMIDEGIGEEDAARVLFKSRRHHDGGMYEGMFIVGINCGMEGQPKWATWHCEGEWWDRFMIPELDHAPEWDGHTPQDALERLLYAFTPKEEK